MAGQICDAGKDCSVLRLGVSLIYPPKAPAQDISYRMDVIADGIDHPWRIAFLPDGQMLVTSRAGKLFIFREGEPKREISGVPQVYAVNQGGLFEAVPHPDFANNGLIYLVYAHGTSEANGTRAARAKLMGDALYDLQVLFTAKPLKAGSAHFGGRMVFYLTAHFCLRWETALNIASRRSFWITISAKSSGSMRMGLSRRIILS